MADPLDNYPPMMTTTEVSEYTGIDAATLTQWRHRPPRGGGPPYVKMSSDRNGIIRYPREELRIYLAERLVAGTSAARTGA